MTLATQALRAAAILAASCGLLASCATVPHDAPLPDPSSFIAKARAPRRPDIAAMTGGLPPIVPSDFGPSLTACLATRQAGSGVVVADVRAREAVEAFLGPVIAHGRVQLRAWIGPYPGSGGPGSEAVGGWFDDGNLDAEDKRFLSGRFGAVVMMAPWIEGSFFQSNDTVCAAQLVARFSARDSGRLCIDGDDRWPACRVACDAAGCRKAPPTLR